MSHLISLSRYQAKCVIKSLFKQVMTSQTLRFFFESTSKAMADREQKRGRRIYKNLNISRTKRTF